MIYKGKRSYRSCKFSDDNQRATDRVVEKPGEQTHEVGSPLIFYHQQTDWRFCALIEDAGFCKCCLDQWLLTSW